MPDMNENAETQQEYFGKAKLETDYKDLSILLYKRIIDLEHQLTHRNCLDCSNHSSKLRMRTLELEKENTKLKARVSEQSERISELTQELDDVINRFE